MFKSTKRSLLSLIAAIFVVMLSYSDAAAGKFYVGASVGQSSVDGLDAAASDPSLSSVSVDDSDTGYKGFVGWRFFKFFSVQAAWMDIGEVSLKATSDGTGGIPMGQYSATAELDGFALSAVLTIPVHNRVSLFAHYGTFEWDSSTTETDPSGSISSSDSGSDTLIGLGVSFNLPGPGAVRLEYEEFEIDGIDVSLASAGYTFRF